MIASNTLRTNLIKIKEHETNCDKDFISKKFEDNTSKNLALLYEHYRGNLPVEFKSKENQDKKRKFIEFKKIKKIKFLR